MPVIRQADGRRTETPNAVMTTLASPTQGGAPWPVWRVDMEHGQSGPQHEMDAEQVLTVISGAATVEVGGSVTILEVGDTAVVAGGVLRRIAAADGERATMIVAGAPEARASLPDGTDRGVPPWTA
ncbi:Cupin domain-containing protein [Haloactinopolyspora alba]|uniref:Cupin domain-containing protein n=1 Tax=Haloactinopolyspora alba TaxID=648780 RepID=A0A2P8DM19_9ACTN|nr:cupin domain-containing protein [Haloactinopolyspora alba]PSK98248.1 Cupin domain-containing protein [Haloactinopolyspora alba]